jgi:hypothetical protein
MDRARSNASGLPSPLTLNMQVNPSRLPREEQEPETLFTEDRKMMSSHVSIFDLYTAFMKSAIYTSTLKPNSTSEPA